MEELREEMAVPEPTAEPLLDLDAPRIIPLHIGRHLVTWHFAPITAKMWRRYFRSIVNEVEQVGNLRRRVFDTDTALVELVRGAVTRVEGYTMKTASLGGRNWRNALPIAHCVAVGRVLRSAAVEPANPDAVPVLGELVEISLTAPWSMGEQGTTTIFSGLIHRFRQPTIQQMVSWRRECARTDVTVRGEYQVTTFPSQQELAMKLYDSLIAEVDGYSAGGKALASTRPEEIATAMDGIHKAVSIMELFSGEREELSLGSDGDQEGNPDAEDADENASTAQDDDPDED